MCVAKYIGGNPISLNLGELAAHGPVACSTVRCEATPRAHSRLREIDINTLQGKVFLAVQICGDLATPADASGSVGDRAWTAEVSAANLALERHKPCADVAALGHGCSIYGAPESARLAKSDTSRSPTAGIPACAWAVKHPRSARCSQGEVGWLVRAFAGVRSYDVTPLWLGWGFERPARLHRAVDELGLSVEHVRFAAHQVVPDRLEVQPADVLAADVLAAVA